MKPLRRLGRRVADLEAVVEVERNTVTPEEALAALHAARATFQPLTRARVAEIVEERRAGFGVPPRLPEGLTLEMQATLRRLTGDPDPRQFANADAYAEAVRAWLMKGVVDDRQPASAAGRTTEEGPS